MNVLEAWALGFTGKGVVVTILDDGVQPNHPDLKDNYDPLASKDINDNDDDPTPQDNGDNKHGTRCAGEVAAGANNKFCGAGIAYNSGIGGVRMLDGLVNDAVEARSLSANPDHIDIYSASWGPEDDGKTVDGPGPLAKKAFIKGVQEGRGGRGSIFVWASGNGGHHTDNCNCDGYTNSIYTLSISSATQAGTRPWYLEQCSSSLASTYSSGTPGQHSSITTTDQDARLRPDKLCTSSHTGTSASAPLAAGVMALTLEAKPSLTWRDLQHLVVVTSNPQPLLAEAGWAKNSLGRLVSHKFGYGLLDAGQLVRRAADWSLVDPQRVCETRVETVDSQLGPDPGSIAQVSLITDGCDNSGARIRWLEHVQARLSLKFKPRGDLKIKLTSPRGTESWLLLPRPKDRQGSSFDNWPFLSVHYWGEDPTGEWRLEVSHGGSKAAPAPGVLKHWQLVLHGTETDPLNPAPRREDDITTRDTTLGACHGECLDTCSGPGPRDCHACRHVSQNSTCLSACPAGSWVSSLEKKGECLPCHYTCGTCYGPNSDNCQTCSDEMKLIPDQSTCVEACPPGSVHNRATDQCGHCPRHCLSCDSKDSCLKCSPGMVLARFRCQPRCGNGQYMNIDTGGCDTCHKDCATCVGPLDTECGRCKKGLIYFERRCVSYCPAGYTLAEDGSECRACPLGCDTCPSHAATCLNCTRDWSLTSESGCRSRESSRCVPGLYPDPQGTCLACDSTCRTCSGPGPEVCSTCYPDLKQHLATCGQACPPGEHHNRVSQPQSLTILLFRNIPSRQGQQMHRLSSLL